MLQLWWLYFFTFGAMPFLSAYSPLLLFLLFEEERDRILRSNSKGFLHFLLPLSFWNLFLCKFFLRHGFLYHDSSLSWFSNSRSRSGGKCYSSVYTNYRDLIFNSWRGKGLFDKSHYSLLAFSSLLKNWREASFFSFLLFLALFRRLGISFFWCWPPQ